MQFTQSIHGTDTHTYNLEYNQSNKSTNISFISLLLEYTEKLGKLNKKLN